MSFWLRCGVKITDLNCFKQSCEKHGIVYEENQDEHFKMKGSPVHATLHDSQGQRNTGYVVRKGGAYALMVDNDLTTLEIAHGDLKVALGRGLPAGAAAPSAAAPAPVTPAPAVADDDEPAEADALIEIKSPMVGTLYAASSPDVEPFVAIGDRVSGDTVVCIVEAMKVMNEIKAECSGTVVDVAAVNGQPVEYGQVLFRVKP